MLKVEQFKTLFPNSKVEHNKFVTVLNAKMESAGINTPARIAAFIAQCGHESAGFSTFSENLNYSSIGLVTTFGKYFDKNTSMAYARNPQKIANKVYASRMGNGNEASGDGWKYRGRGLIQLTGKDNYTAFSPEAAKDPDLLVSSYDYMISSAIWFWTKNSLNALADKGDLVTLTKRINGGTHGLAERVALSNKILKML
jgi:putative chitinase